MFPILSFEYVEEYFFNNDCILLKNNVIENSKTKLRYIASCGHERIIAWTKFQQGQGRVCRDCSYEKRFDKRRKPIENVQKIFKENGCILLSTTYVNYASELYYIAKCGHTNFRSLGNFLKEDHNLCFDCNKAITINKQKHTIENVKQTFEDVGCKMLSDEYIDNATIIHYIAVCGHEEEIYYHNFQQGQGLLCKKCARIITSEAQSFSYETVKKIFEEKGCKLLSPNYENSSIKLTYIAQCGHEYKCTLGNFKNGGFGLKCLKCRQKNFSNTACQWIENLIQTENIYIQYVRNGGEFQIPATKYKADGYCEETNTIYEFYGDFWHGNPALFDSNDENPIVKMTYGELYEKTKKREQAIKKLGYNLITIWESEYVKLSKV